MISTIISRPTLLALSKSSLKSTSTRSFSSTPAPQATLRELEIRIKSVGNIGKITKSMKMVAASRLARAQKAMTNAKAYGQANNAVFTQSEAAKSEAKIEKIMYIVVSSDRGLCGGIHSSVAKMARKDVEGGEGVGKEVSVVCLGEKPKQQLVRSIATDLALTFNQIGRNCPTFSDALAIADRIEAEGLQYDKVRSSCFSVPFDLASARY
jgi:F-type H+-transporting ATPase subunit gamma